MSIAATLFSAAQNQSMMDAVSPTLAEHNSENHISLATNNNVRDNVVSKSVCNRFVLNNNENVIENESHALATESESKETTEAESMSSRCNGITSENDLTQNCDSDNALALTSIGVNNNDMTIGFADDDDDDDDSNGSKLETQRQVEGACCNSSEQIDGGDNVIDGE